MTNNDNNRAYTTGISDGEQPSGFDPDDTPPAEQRREPVFSAFDEEEEDGYEEPDRDTDYASGYHEETLEDEEFDDSPLEDDDVTPQAQKEWEEPQPVVSWEEPDPELELEPGQQDLDEADESYASVDDEEDDDDEWEDEEEYLAEDAGDMQKWPLGLIAVAIVALLLLAAGGYGVIQQRSATQEEIRHLQAALATAANPAEVSASRDALQQVEERNRSLQTSVDTLTLENRRLTDTVAGLESQLEAQQAAVARQAVAAPAPVKPEPATPKAATPEPATPEPAAPKPVAAVATGGGPWFVNFSSYGQRSAAESWAAKLQPETGKVVVTTGSKEGATFYRVRVIELASRESADKIARQLENEFGLSKLWVGKQ